jgi:hypothetical protein
MASVGIKARTDTRVEAENRQKSGSFGRHPQPEQR